MKVKAAIQPGPGETIVIDEIEIGDPGPRQVLVRLFASGICNSQLKQHTAPRATPQLLGHEGTGEVLATGSDVVRMSPGDHVLISVIPTVREGEEYPKPAAWSWRGNTYIDHLDNVNSFTFATHTLVDERSLTPVPKTLPTDVSSILGCAGVTGCGSVVNVADAKPGDSVAVWGVGGVGGCAVIAAAAVGANPVIAVDIEDERLELATALGATHRVNAAITDAVAEIKEITGGGADYVIDTVGRTEDVLSAVRAGIPGQKRGGAAVSIGRPSGSDNLQAYLAYGRSYHHSAAGDGRPIRDLPKYVEWHQQGKFPLETLVTKQYRLEQVNEALDDLASGRTMGRSIIVLD